MVAAVAEMSERILPARTERELRVGQIYRQRFIKKVRNVQITQIDTKAGDVYLRRIGPCTARELGRRTVRRLDDFHINFEFVLEELVFAHCSKCSRAIKNYIYPTTVRSEFCGVEGECWDCSLRNRKNRP